MIIPYEKIDNPPPPNKAGTPNEVIRLMPAGVKNKLAAFKASQDDLAQWSEPILQWMAGHQLTQITNGRRSRGQLVLSDLGWRVVRSLQERTRGRP